MIVLPRSRPARRRQLVILGGLVLALGAFAWWQWGTPAIAPRASSNRQVQAPATGRGAPRLPEPLKLDALVAAPDTATVGRNPFGYGERPAPPAPPPARPSAAPAMPVLPPVPAGPPPIGVRLLGLTALPESGRVMATLRDPATGAVFQAFEGDIVDGRYRVVKVGVQSVILSYVDGSGSRTIPLGG
jgi:hypothetical protein